MVLTSVLLRRCSSLVGNAIFCFASSTHLSFDVPSNVLTVSSASSFAFAKRDRRVFLVGVTIPTLPVPRDKVLRDVFLWLGGIVCHGVTVPTDPVVKFSFDFVMVYNFIHDVFV